MKKPFPLMLALALALPPSFAGCGGNDAPPANPVPDTNLGGGSSDPGALIPPPPPSDPESGSATN